MKTNDKEKNRTLKDETDAPPIELRSEEVQEIMGQIPPMILRVGIGIISACLLILTLLASFVKYPERIDVPVTISNVGRHVELTSETSGTLIAKSLDYGTMVDIGDTVYSIVSQDSTFHHIAKEVGKVYPISLAKTGEYIQGGIPLCVITDSVSRIISAVGLINLEAKIMLRKHMKAEIEYESRTLVGLIDDIGEVSIPENDKFPIRCLFENERDYLRQPVIERKAMVRITIRNHSILKRFIHTRFNTHR